MAISYNTGTTSTITAGTASGHTFTIPAGVLSGDIIYVLVGVFTTATGSLTMTLSSSATAPTTVGAQQNTGINAGIQVSSQVFQIKAGGSDASATLTYGATGGSGGSYWFNVGLVSYTGANSTNPDVNAGTEFFNASSVGTTTTPSATTGVSGDWQIQLLMVAPPNGANFTTPGGLTSRQAITSGGNAGILLAIADSNASVGGSGTAIGNTTWTASGAGASNTWSTSFTIGLAPPSGAAVSGSVQPRSTVLVPRRVPARALWRGGAGSGITAVPAPHQQPRTLPRRTPARAYVLGTPLVTSNAKPNATPVTLTGGLLPYAGGVLLQTFSQTFTSSGSWTAPSNLAGPPAVYAWGPSGTAASGTAGTGAGGGGGGSFGGEPALGQVTAGTVLTVTVGAPGSGNPTTVTGGSVTVTGNAGGNASAGTGGTAGAASGNTLAFAGGFGGNGVAGGSGGGGGGGGSGGAAGAGGNGGAASGATGGSAGTAGAGNPGGAAGGVGGTGSSGGAGTAPGGAGGGGSGGAIHTGGAATAGQALITWQVLVPVQMAMRRRTPARAQVQFTPVRTANTVTVVAVAAPRQSSTAFPRRVPARAYVRFTPVATTNASVVVVAVPAPRRQPGPAPRRTPARAYIQFRPVRTVNAAPPVILGTPPTIPTSGGDRSPTIRVYREIRPGDVPVSGAQLPKLTGRAFAMPIPTDTDHVTHAWDEQLEDEPVIPAGPSLLDQARAELDELAKAARDAAEAIDRAADRARPIVEGIGSKAYDLGKIFGQQPYDPRPRKVCGATRMTGGVALTCQRKPHDDGWHSDKGLHWR